MLTGLIAALVLVMAGCDSAGGLGAAAAGQRVVRRHPGAAIELSPTKERAATEAAR